jgi:glycosyltransferase involved in cell wall biosynthesis
MNAAESMVSNRPERPAPLRILFVAPYAPSPIRVRTYHLLRNLCARGHRVHLVCPAGDSDAADLAAVRALGATVTTSPHQRSDALRSYLRALPTHLPLQAAHCLNDAFVGAIRAALAAAPYDVIHVEHLRAAEVALRAVAGLPAAPPIVFDSVDCISLLFERALRRSPSFTTRLMAMADLARTQRYEAQYGRRFAAIAVTSPEDRWALEQLRERFHINGPASIVVAPNGVDLDYFAPQATPRKPATLVFSGKLSYHANHAAALFLVREIMPLVWRSRADVRVVLAGAAPRPELQELACDPRVTVTGFVPDLRPYLATATLAVCPIRYGVGIQNKVLEAMAMATPVIAARQTTVALSAEPGRDLLTAEEPHDYAAAILELLADPARAAALGAAGRRYVEAHHTWAAGVAAFEACYRHAGGAAVLQPPHTPPLSRPAANDAVIM